MNIDSEIRHFRDLSANEQARHLVHFLYELTLEARNFYGAGNQHPIDASTLRFINEIQYRLTRYVEQILIDDPARPSEENVLKLLLAPRTEKGIETLVFSAWTRTVQATG
jgi:hypothetical protein